MNIKIKKALISVFNKDGLEPVARKLNELGVEIYSTGGTEHYISGLGIPVTSVESVTAYPSILGGRVKTLHPKIFGGILGRTNIETDAAEMDNYEIPSFDLVIVDLYPFEQTIAETSDESKIIEKIDVGGPSMIRAAAKNFSRVMVVSSRNEYVNFLGLLEAGSGSTSLEQRKEYAARAFALVAHYDYVISNYFNEREDGNFQLSVLQKRSLRYGENPHQQSGFFGDLESFFDQLNGKELSFNNLVDVDAAIQLISDFPAINDELTFAIIKHTNVCGIATRPSISQAWIAALAGDPESAFGGVLIANGDIDEETASMINDIFFEVILAPGFSREALTILKSKKNRIILKMKEAQLPSRQFKSVLNGVLVQESDKINYDDWKEEGGRKSSDTEKADLIFANLVCKHLKSNAIVLVRNKQLIGKGCGQTSRIDALRQAIDKSKQFEFSLQSSVLASDAFFPFDDCVKMAHEAGVGSFIQPGGSIRDKDSIEYCVKHKLVMVITGARHFKH